MEGETCTVIVVNILVQHRVFEQRVLKIVIIIKLIKYIHTIYVSCQIIGVIQESGNKKKYRASTVEPLSNSFIHM